MKVIRAAWAWLKSLWRSLISVLGFGFKDAVVNGVPNLEEMSHGLWRSGQPADAAAWAHLRSKVEEPGKQVLVVKLNFEAEGDDSPADFFPGWTVLRIPVPPDGERPWTVLVRPDPIQVNIAYEEIARAAASGKTVVWHCTHGRDRTGLMAAIVRMRMFGWTKEAAWDDMIAHGFRWQLPNLDAYWLDDA